MRDLEDLLLRTDSRALIPHCEEFFEGPEKLFEITFKTREREEEEEEGSEGKKGLRRVDKATWEDMLKLVKCEIVSFISNEEVDSYLLSESSLFVFPQRLMLKTCGTTTLLHAVPRVLEIAKTCGFTEVESVFYTRKNFLEPEKQLFPHNNFGDEVRALDGIFDNGTAYVLGKLNGDHLYVYTYENPTVLKHAPDQNLEILMHDLDHEAAKVFYRGSDFIGSRETTIASGVADIFPQAKLDDLVFDPCGYSINGIFDQYYFTIHVTPQPGFSFASFETNAPVDDYTPLVERVLDIFKPGRYSVTVVCNESAKCGNSIDSFNTKPLEGFSRDDKAHYEFAAYNLTYAHYEKFC